MYYGVLLPESHSKASKSNITVKLLGGRQFKEDNMVLGSLN